MRKLPEYLKEEDFNQTELQKLLNSGELENDIDSFNTISFSTETTNQDSKLENYIMLIPTEKRKAMKKNTESFSSKREMKQKEERGYRRIGRKNRPNWSEIMHLKYLAVWKLNKV